MLIVNSVPAGFKTWAAQINSDEPSPNWYSIVRNLARNNHDDEQFEFFMTLTYLLDRLFCPLD